jgi:hypothetical protein
MIPWSVNRNPNRNPDKSIGIAIGTRTINTSRGHGTACTRSERAQCWWSHVGPGKIYITRSNAWALC